MSTDAPTENERLRTFAIEQVERMRRLKLRLAVFLLAMLVLAPVWLVTEYLEAGGWPQRLSNNGNPGDWDPWLLWVALAWGFYVAVTAVAVYFRRPTTEAEIDRELARIRESVPGRPARV